MPKLWQDEDEIIDLSEINPNKMFAMSYNFELLKYVITSLIRNQQNFDSQLSDLKLSFLKQKKYSTQLEISIIDLKMQREEDPAILEELLKQKKEINSKNEEYEKDLESFEKGNPKKISIYNMKEPKKLDNMPEYGDEIVTTDINIIQKKISKEKVKEKEKDKDDDKKGLNNKKIEEEKEEEKEKEKEKEKEEKKEEKKEEVKKEEKIIEEKKEERKIEEKKEETKKEEVKKEEIENKEIENKEKEKKEIENKENINKEIEKKEIEKEEKKIEENVEKKIEEKEEETIEEEQKEQKIVIPPPTPIYSTQSKSAENEKTKVINEDFHKQLLLIVGELKNLKSKHQTLDKDFNLFKMETTEQIKEKLENNIPSMIDTAFETKITSMQKSIKKDIDKINEDINTINTTYDQKLNDFKNNILKEISSKNEIYNQHFEKIKNSFASLRENLSLTNEKLSNMVTSLSFNNLKKDLIERIESEKKVINLEISILKSNVNNTKNQLFDHLSDSRDHDNLVNLMKIMDSISNNIQKLMEFKRLIEEKDKRKAIAENNKYVKQEGFNEAISNIHKYMDNNKKEFSEIRLDIDSIKSKDLNIKANLRDLKNLEESVFTKMEALKETIRDNFVEKNMLVKNLKYLELQTKQLIEENKKVEKQESWLLAKKPFNGHLCASCEAYLGDLKPITNSKFVAWNKYPPSNSIDKIFRINAGFSKVLQMVNQDRKSNSLNNSKDERNCSSAEDEKRKNEKIPNYKGKSRDKNNLKQNNSSTQIDENEFVGTLPKISVKKNSKLSTDNIFEERNKTPSNIGYNKNFNLIKSPSYIDYKKSRKLVEETDNRNLQVNDDDENNELQKPKITKVFRKIGENADKKNDNDKV